MQFRSLIQVRNELQIIDVELSLVPGLPQIVFLGLPDQALRESAIRIRSAIRAQGFRFPPAQRVLVQLKPSHVKKSSRGLDLAVAAALLWETEQLPRPDCESPLLYGELTLKGEVRRPDDLEGFIRSSQFDGRVWTGSGNALPVPTSELTSLNSLRHPVERAAERLQKKWSRPVCPVSSFDFESAEVGALIAAGEHSTLITGPPGVGKSTLADSIASWIEAPTELSRCDLSWRPVHRPHHSATPRAMIGGGTNLWAGEISKAHQGVLILDECMEFSSEAQDALREPMDTGSICIARGGEARVFPARALVLATTNLCRCGRFLPGPQDRSRCKCRSADRRRHLARLTGAFADRFAMLLYLDPLRSRGPKISSEEIERRACRAINFRLARGQALPNAWFDVEPLAQSLSEYQRKNILEDVPFASQRRYASVLRVARTLADLDRRHEIRDGDLARAIQLCVRNHRLLEESDD